MPYLPREFDAAQACAYSGASSRQLRYWDQVGLVRPSVRQTGGVPGVPRRYSREDVVVLAAIVKLLRAGTSLQAIRGTEKGPPMLERVFERLAVAETWSRDRDEHRRIVGAGRWAA